MSFGKDPLKNFLKKLNKSKKTFDHSKILNEWTFMVIVLLIFLGGLFFLFTQENASITGQTIYDSNTQKIIVNKAITESSELNFLLNGNLTSLKLNGAITGNGSVVIYLGDYVVLNSSDLSTSLEGTLITGFVIAGIESNLSENQVEPILNITTNASIDSQLDDAINNTFTNTTSIQESAVVNLTEIEFYENISINDSINNIQNVSKDINQSINQSIENEIIILNITIEENISTNITSLNLTSINETLLNETDLIVGTLEKNYSNNITSVNITEIIVNITQNITFNLSINESVINITLNETNISTNISIFNQTINATLFINETNLTMDELLINETIQDIIKVVFFENYCKDTCYMSNLPQNITLRIVIDGAKLNLSSIIYNYIEPINLPKIIQLQGYDKFLYSLKNLTVLGSSVSLTNEISLKIGEDNSNFLEFKTSNLSFVDVDIFNLKDTRITSKTVKFADKITNVKITLNANDADLILKCVQFNETCKKWEKTDIDFNKKNNLVTFSPQEHGIYAIGLINQVKKEYIPASSVYYNSDCDKCRNKFICDAKEFCPMQDKLKEGYNFAAQLDFDIFNFDDIKSAKLCSYVSYKSNQSITNYLKYSPESFCSDIHNGNSVSEIIEYFVIEKSDDWICVDATQILLESIKKKESNVFINWIGPNLGGKSYPIACFSGTDNLENCGGQNPSGAKDCRPYLKIKYE